MELIDKARQLISEENYGGEGNSKKCYYVNIEGKDYVLLVSRISSEDSKQKNDIRIPAIKELYQQGLSTPKLIGIDYDGDIAYELQERGKGKILGYRSFSRVPEGKSLMDDFFTTLRIMDQADKKTFQNLINDITILCRNGYAPDCHPDNFLIDDNGNITLIDLNLYHLPKKMGDIEVFWNLYLQILPFIFSYVTNRNYFDEYERIGECKSLLENIARKWIGVCYDFLLENGFSEEKARKKMESGKDNYSKYFKQNPDTIQEMLDELVHFKVK